ncbi:MAG: type II secretion system protein GspN [Desulfobulbaceae bacterium S5133MH15]|nr:MAG: type II secretion system protein GspN [Desulfobulbaceae bacterium S5133MH15]OEU79808.1 MAG: type II secretion system protein GspN [Desulfobulbaceae bacterium C00003063]
MAGSIFSFRFLSYLVYAVILTAILLYVRFPTEKFRIYCEQRLEQVLGKGKCTIAKIRYHFPASVELRKVEIGQAADAKSNKIVFDWLRLSPGSEGFLTSWTVTGELYGGSLGALLEVQMKEKAFHLKSIKIEKVDIAAIVAHMPSFQREIVGELTVSGDYKAKFGQPMSGFGDGNLHLKEGNVQLVRQVLTLDAMDFEELNIDWKYGDSIFTITAGKMVGQQLNADFTGTLQAPFLPPEGGLNVSGFLVAKKQFLKDKPQIERLMQRLMKQYKKSAVPFRLGGTLNKPTFRLSS